MLCPVCHKAQASEKVEKIVDGRFIEGHVCRDCYIKALSMDKREYYYTFVTLPDKACPVCGRTFGEFSESLLLGCPHCYKTFEQELLPLVDSIQAK